MRNFPVTPVPSVVNGNAIEFHNVSFRLANGHELRAHSILK